jgi:hypothetical protein
VLHCSDYNFINVTKNPYCILMYQDLSVSSAAMCAAKFPFNGIYVAPDLTTTLQKQLNINSDYNNDTGSRGSSDSIVSDYGLDDQAIRL